MAETESEAFAERSKPQKRAIQPSWTKRCDSVPESSFADEGFPSHAEPGARANANAARWFFGDQPTDLAHPDSRGSSLTFGERPAAVSESERDGSGDGVPAMKGVSKLGGSGDLVIESADLGTDDGFLASARVDLGTAHAVSATARGLQASARGDLASAHINLATGSADLVTDSADLARGSDVPARARGSKARSSVSLAGARSSYFSGEMRFATAADDYALKRPNQAPEPTTLLVMSRAYARATPSRAVAHL